jgi:hypothetical protein
MAFVVIIYLLIDQKWSAAVGDDTALLLRLGEGVLAGLLAHGAV